MKRLVASSSAALMALAVLILVVTLREARAIRFNPKSAFDPKFVESMDRQISMERAGMSQPAKKPVVEPPALPDSLFLDSGFKIDATSPRRASGHGIALIEQQDKSWRLEGHLEVLCKSADDFVQILSAYVIPHDVEEELARNKAELERLRD